MVVIQVISSNAWSYSNLFAFGYTCNIILGISFQRARNTSFLNFGIKFIPVGICTELINSAKFKKEGIVKEHFSILNK